MVQLTIEGEPIKRYVLDTSAIVDMWRITHPIDVFPTLWEDLKKLNKGKILLFPSEVIAELSKRDDELLDWIKENSIIIDELDEKQTNMAIDIERDFKNLVDTYKEEADADPFIVALAKSKDYVVITSEKLSGDINYPNIPDVCKAMGIECINNVEFFRQQKLKY